METSMGKNALKTLTRMKDVYTREGDKIICFTHLKAQSNQRKNRFILHYQMQVQGGEVLTKNFICTGVVSPPEDK